MTTAYYGAIWPAAVVGIFALAREVRAAVSSTGQQNTQVPQPRARVENIDGRLVVGRPDTDTAAEAAFRSVPAQKRQS